MNLGQLRHRIQFQEEQQTADGGGGFTLQWVTVGTYWAHIRPASGNETLQASRLEHVISHTATMRYTANISQAMRVLFRGGYYNVVSILNTDYRNKDMTVGLLENVPT